MPSAPVPPNEAERLAALRSFFLLDTDPEPAYDRIVELLQREIGVPIAAVSLVDENREWMKACTGDQAKEGDRQTAFCAYAIMQQSPLIVEDAAADPRFAENPQVVHKGIRFYAGFPLTDPAGYNLGALCIKDTHARKLNDKQIYMLQSLADVVVELMLQNQSRGKQDEALQRLDKLEEQISRRTLELEYAATHDSLTGLINRPSLEKGLQQQRDSANGKLISALFIDLDRFKLVNDTAGHAAGDALLIEIAKRLMYAAANAESEFGLASSPLVARLGGDEFFMAFAGLPHETAARQLARQINDLVRQPVAYEGQELVVGASIGLLPSVDPADDADAIVRHADMAMYHAKANDFAPVIEFDTVLEAKMMRRLQIELDIHKAVERNELQVFFQPIVGLETARTVAAEALVRWIRGSEFISPGEFIPIAEETGAIVPIGWWILEQAVTAAASWVEQGVVPVDFCINVNLSKRQIVEQGFVQRLDEIVSSAGLEPTNLCLEITESMVMDQPEEISPVLEAIRERGHHLSMDDFGTGHSSLTCIHQFPFNQVKIDRAFIMNLEQDIHYAAVIQSIVTLAMNMGMKVTAEGIENTEQLAQLQALECDCAQGYLFSRPLPGDQFELESRQNGSNWLSKPGLQSEAQRKAG